MMPQMYSFTHRIFLIIAIVLLLQACGGGGGGTLPSTQRPVVNPVTEPIESGATVVDPARGGFAEQPVYPATQPQPDKSATSSGKTYVQHKHRLAVFTFTSSSKAVICLA